MQKFFSILALSVLVLGIYLGQKARLAEEILNSSPSITPEKGEENIEGSKKEDDSQKKGVKTDSSVEKIKQSPTPTTPSPSSLGFYETYKYPGSLVLDFSNEVLILRSKDSPEVITDWYKKKIISDGFNVRTFVTTKANDRILNRLVGSQSSKEIDVEITKEAGEEFVKIKVVIKQK